MNLEESKHFKWCNENGIRVYPVPVSNFHTGEYYLVVERNGVGSKGEMIFRDKPTGKNEKSVWDQIKLLLKLIYEKESNQ